MEIIKNILLKGLRLSLLLILIQLPLAVVLANPGIENQVYFLDMGTGIEQKDYDTPFLKAGLQNGGLVINESISRELEEELRGYHDRRGEKPEVYIFYYRYYEVVTKKKIDAGRYTTTQFVNEYDDRSNLRPGRVLPSQKWSELVTEANRRFGLGNKTNYVLYAYLEYYQIINGNGGPQAQMINNGLIPANGTASQFDFSNLRTGGTDTGERIKSAVSDILLRLDRNQLKEETRCDRFTVISQIREEHVNSASTVLKDKFERRKAITGAMRTQGSRYHIMTVGPSVNLDQQKLEILEEKLFLLKAHTGIYMAVILIDLPNNTLYNQEASSLLAGEIIKKAAFAGEEKVVVVTLPHSNYESILWETNQSCMSLGINQAGGNHVALDQFQQNGDFFNTIVSAYATIEKPYYLNYYFVAADGTMLDMKVRSQTNTKGLPYINNIRLFISPHKQQLEEKRTQIQNKLLVLWNVQHRVDSLSRKLYTYEHTWDDGYIRTNEARQRAEVELQQNNQEYLILKLAYEAALLAAMQSDLQAFQESKIDHWTPREQNIGKFRESYMEDAALVKSYMLREMKNSFWQQLQISVGLSTIEANHLYKYDVWVPIDKAVYNTLDVVSFIPFVSDAADFAGLFYSTIRGDYQNSAVYGAGLAIPFAIGGGAIRAADNVYVAVAKRLDTGEIVYIAKRVDEILEGEFHVFSMLAKNEADAIKIMDDALPHVDRNGVRELLENIAKLNRFSVQFSRAAFERISGFSDQITSLVAKEGMDVNTFKIIQAKTADDLMTSGQLSAINNIRNSIPHPSRNTLMQKVIHQSDISNYLSGNYTSCRGYVTTAADAKHLRTPEDIFFGMRLDYSGTKFTQADNSCGVIRFKAHNSSSAIVPRSPVNGGTVTDGAPFTGQGFTAASNGRLAVPEWKMDDWAILQEAELWEVFSDGREILVGVYDTTLGKFIAR